MEQEQYFEEQLDRLHRAHQAGIFAALIEALALCGPNSEPLPKWLWTALFDVLVAVHSGSPPKLGRGASNTYQRRLERDREDHKRWQTAQIFLRILEGQRAHLANLPRDKRRLIHKPIKLRTLFGHYSLSRAGAFKAAAKLLGQVHVGPDAIRKAFNRVEKSRIKGNASRYELAASVRLSRLERVDINTLMANYNANVRFARSESDT